MTNTAVSTPPSFAAYATAMRAEIDAALGRVLPRPPACPPVVAEAMRYAITVGGKRMRPILTLATAEAVARANGSVNDAAIADARRLAMPAACAIEMIHSYSLVHDDLPAMDDDCLRRGKPTLHVLYGDGLAILAGDGLHAEAFALLAHEPDSERDPDLGARKLRVIQRIGRAVGGAGMVGGQAIDLEAAGLVTAPGRSRVPCALNGPALRDMHARKTGLLIRAAAVSGAIMAGGTSAQVEAIDGFAEDLGLVFQVIDDILDVEGSREGLGKTPGKDAASGKPTYPALFGLARSRALAAEGIARAEQTLRDARLLDPHLLAIAHWVVARDC